MIRIQSEEFSAATLALDNHYDQLYQPWNNEAAATVAQPCIGASAPARCCVLLVADRGDSPAGAGVSGQGKGYPLAAILGPTASAKSALAIFLAERLAGEIINYDSVQIYRGLDIGSAKVSSEERARVPHHLLDVADPNEVFTAGQYRRAALQAVEGVRRRKKLPILAGGTGLYLRALLDGLFEGPQRSEQLRDRIRAIQRRHNPPFIHRLLARMDPAAAARIHPHDVQKLIRAIEVCILAGEPISVLQRGGGEGLTGFEILKIGLNPDRTELRCRINRRVEAMFTSGLIEETRSVLFRDGQSARNGALKSLGYRQSLAALEGEMTPQEAVEAAQAATRRYAKRQMTWFRREANVLWFSGFGDDPAIQLRVLQTLRTVTGACSGGPLLSLSQIHHPDPPEGLVL
ncbi:MAG: tRNA (adenosine(37)-N6)-dimethylallyltransferase MiaA [Terriglobia bacterium]